MLRATLQALRCHSAPRSAPAAPRRALCAGGSPGDAAAACDAQLPLSRELLRCRTTKEFLQYALRRGAVLKRQTGTHATVEAGGVPYTLVVTSKKDLMESARKVTFKIFDQMGIARDARPRRGGELGKQWSTADAAQRAADR